MGRKQGENMNNETEFLTIDNAEDQITHREYYKFPAVYIQECNIYFNAFCKGLFHCNRLRVTKTSNLIIFRESDTFDSFPIRWHTSCDAFSICGVRIKRISGLSSGSYFRLYPVKGGGYAIKRLEPLSREDSEC